MYSIRLRAGIISLLVGISMLLMKFTAYFLTNSAAIFSDALESIVHIAATSMALFSIYYSSKPPDKEHPYGHGNMEYFSAGVEGASDSDRCTRNNILCHYGYNLSSGYKTT
ncbi:MAG: cation transporter [Ignavibacteriales bacterium]|nr:cation transporter [Ignavibacteriales bacterium]